MISPDDLFTLIGVKLHDLVAGFAGGVANAVVFRKSNPWAIIGSIVVGGFAANYLGGLAAKVLGTSTDTSAFIVGLTGMSICQGIIESCGSLKLLRGSKND